MRSQSVWLTACSAALAVALAGCGGKDGDPDPEATGPRIEQATADHLADLSDQIADRIESGDRCGAGAAAGQLRDAVTAAINEGKVPSLYLEDLSGAANELELAAPRCVPRPPPPPETSEDEAEADDDGKAKKRKEKEDKEKKGDDDEVATTETAPPETVPEETTTEEEPPPATTGTTTETTTTETVP